MDCFQQGCQMEYFQTKKSQFGSILEGLAMEDVEIFFDIWSILRPFQIFYGHSVYFMVICYIFPRVGIVHQEQSGNPGFQEPILRFLNLQLQRQHCSRLERFNIGEK
jgi:hypothetical protein